ncbi:trehalose-phosphatase [Sphingobium sp. AN641]|uniref:trehalose-phosphatase n=1 Tax=Sphingobium sp. AN641 TaxID=3133443 RepID=UPI0030BD2F2D
MSRSPLPVAPPLPPPPFALLNGAALFLDFDGTLVDIADTPDSVRVDRALVRLLHALRAGLDGRLAIVSGRSVGTLRQLGLGDFLLAGTHGLELVRPGQPVDAPVPLPAIDAVESRLLAFVADRPGLLVERKPLSVGLHFRLAPLAADACEAIATTLAAQFGLHLQRGKMLFELRPGGADKGSAVTALMACTPMSAGVPLFIGDDVTDEEGFAAAAALGGHGVLVGPHRTTLAAWSLEQVAAVRHYLSEGVAAMG